MRCLIIIIASMGLLVGQSVLAGEMVRYEHTMTVAAKNRHHAQQKKAQASSDIKKQSAQSSPSLPRHHRLDHRAEMNLNSQENRAMAIKNRG